MLLGKSPAASCASGLEQTCARLPVCRPRECQVHLGEMREATPLRGRPCSLRKVVRPPATRAPCCGRENESSRRRGLFDPGAHVSLKGQVFIRPPQDKEPLGKSLLEVETGPVALKGHSRPAQGWSHKECDRTGTDKSDEQPGADREAVTFRDPEGRCPRFHEG